MSATQGTGEPETPALLFRRSRQFPVSFSFRRVRQIPRVLARGYLSLSLPKSTLTDPRTRSYPTTVRRAVTPVLRRRRLPHLAQPRCLPNPEGSPWSSYAGAGFLRGGEGVYSHLEGDSLRTVDPHRFSRNRNLPLFSPARRTTSAHADVGKRFKVTGTALRAVLSGANEVSAGGNLVVLRCRRLRERVNPRTGPRRFAARRRYPVSFSLHRAQ